ncbi:MAG: TrmB family transcriptional regulator [Candidatus Methanoperedens sp.]|nr:TrmB family transcriptional regulator [Candidatus Methanoperedens sp.]
MLQDEVILSILTQENSKKILLSLVDSDNSAQELSKKLDIPISTTYRILNDLENKNVIGVNKMTLSYDGHHSKIYHAKFNKIILTIDSNNIKVHYMMDDSKKLSEIWNKLSDTS